MRTNSTAADIMRPLVRCAWSSRAGVSYGDTAAEHYERYGIYMGDEPYAGASPWCRPGTLNPKIILLPEGWKIGDPLVDAGTIWGAECWWQPVTARDAADGS